MSKCLIMKIHLMLKAYASLAEFRGNLREYVQIKIVERVKLLTLEEVVFQ